MSSININSQDQNFKHIHKSQLCFCTNELFPEDEIVKFEMSGRRYGGSFAGDVWTLQIHKDIAEQLKHEGRLDDNWFDNDKMRIPTSDKTYDFYECEDEIVSLILSISTVENREYIMNCENTYWGSVSREDWIRDEYKYGKICNKESADYVALGIALEEAYTNEDISDIPNELEV